jgi:predicted GIY-YIG superfamily endonuclease
MDNDETKRTYTLYRISDVAGNLLYVGATTNWPRRIYDHERKKPWYRKAMLIKLAHFDTFEELEIAEGNAISRDRPQFNYTLRKANRGKPRRPSGSGSLCQTPDGMWVGTVELGPHPINGKRHQKRVYSMNRDECERKLEAVKAQLAQRKTK